MTNRNVPVIVLLLALLFCRNAVASSATALPAEVVTAAQSGLLRFAREAAGHEKRRTNTLVLAKGFPVRDMRPDAVRANSTSMDVNTLCTDPIEYCFLIKKNSIPCAVLIVAYVKGQWRGVSFGYPGLAKELAAIETQWGGGADAGIEVIRSPQTGSLYFTIPERGPSNLTPLRGYAAPEENSGGYPNLGSIEHELNLLRRKPFYVQPGGTP